MFEAVFEMCEAAARPMPYMTCDEWAKTDQEAGARYALVLPTATRVRKIGCTTVALNVGEGAEASMVTCQLSQIDKLHYQAFVGDINSAQTFQSMEAFRKKEMIRGFKDDRKV